MAVVAAELVVRLLVLEGPAAEAKDNAIARHKRPLPVLPTQEVGVAGLMQQPQPLLVVQA